MALCRKCFSYILCFALVSSLILSGAGGIWSARAAQTNGDHTVEVNPYTPTVLVDGELVEFAAYNIDGYGYFKLRDIAMVLDGTEKSFSVEWSEERNAIILEPGKPYAAQGGELEVPAKISTERGVRSTSTVILDGKKQDLTAFTIKGYNYFKLRDLAAAIDFGVGWDGTTNTVSIDSTTGYVPEEASAAESPKVVDAEIVYKRLKIENIRHSYPLLSIDGEEYIGLGDLASLFSLTSLRFDIDRGRLDSEHSGRRAYELVIGKPYTRTNSDEEIRKKLQDWLIVNRSFNTDAFVEVTQSFTSLIVNGVEWDIEAYVYEGVPFFHMRELGKALNYDLVRRENNDITTFEFLPNVEGVHRLSAIETNYAVWNTLATRQARWASIPNRYLFVDPSDRILGVVTAYPWESYDVRTDDTAIEIQTYDQDLNLLSTKRVDFELPIFGGFYAGEKYNYIAFGQLNTEENDQKEVIRVVKYDKDFNRIASVSVYGRESITTIPFDAARGRMAEYGDTLVFHTSRERYRTPDGLNHQSQLTLVIDTSAMRVTNALGQFQRNHVSHSFDQYVLFDGGSHVLLDHGDAYPRSIVLHKSAGSNYTSLDLVDIPGPSGANVTGVSIGGFEASSTHYLALYNTVDHSKVEGYTNFELVGYMSKELPDIEYIMQRRDIMVAAVPKNQLHPSQVEHITLYPYRDTDRTSSRPFLVKVGADRYMVLWQEYQIHVSEDYYGNPRESLTATGVRVLYMDGRGKPLTETSFVEGYKLSESDPVVFGDQVVWYLDNGSEQLLYTLPIE